MIPSSASLPHVRSSIAHNRTSASLVGPAAGRRSITSGGIQQPNRFTRYFQQLKATCPDQIKAYADCVNYHAHHGQQSAGAGTDGDGDGDGDDGSMMLRKGSCQDEFDQVKDCWRTIRRKDLQQS